MLLLRLHGCEVLSFEVSLSLLLGSNQAILICLIGTGYLCTLLAWWSMLAMVGGMALLAIQLTRAVQQSSCVVFLSVEGGCRRVVRTVMLGCDISVMT